MIRKLITNTDYEYIDITWDDTRYIIRRELDGSPDYVPLTPQEFDKAIEFKREVEVGQLNKKKEGSLKS